uniref:substrate-binding periplasmic protein n=1 Tax=Cellvibrio fontiphilus TaxID=1815559 RepID=UPI002B4BC691|nr:transporter substrate-binding domain-containing protein [Cellvibrio fontiphilus]
MLSRSLASLVSLLAIQLLITTPLFAASPNHPTTADSQTDEIKLRLGAEDSWPPYSDASGKGISVDLIKAALNNSGVTPIFHVLPYARVLHDLDSGKIDGGFNVNRQATTEAKYIFGEVPLLTVRSYWFFAAGRHQQIKSIKDVPDKFRVGVIRDYEYGDDYEQQRYRFTEVKVSQQSQIIRMLKQGRIDAGIMFEREAEYAMHQLQMKADVFDKRFLNHEGDVYVAFSHKSPRARWMAQELDKGLLMLKQTGEYDRLIAHQTNN